MRRTIPETVAVREGLEQGYYQAGIGTYTGAAVDTRDFEDILVVVPIGYLFACTIDVKVQESANGTSGWSDITGAAFDQIVIGDANTIKLASLRAGTHARYIRAHLTIASADGNIGVFFFGAARITPAVQSLATLDFDVSP